MSPFLKTRESPRQNRVSRRLRLAAPGGVFASSPEGASFVHAAGLSSVPGLSMPEPDDRRGILISSAVSALLHLLAIGGLAVVGVLARQAVEKVIPVVVLNRSIELPGSNDPSPLPVPKLLTAPIASAVPLAMAPSDLSAVPAPIVTAPTFEATAPKALDPFELNKALLAATADLTPAPSAADITEVEPLEITAAELLAPKVELSGPTETAERTATDLDAPSAFESLADLTTSPYEGTVAAVPIATEDIESGGQIVAAGVAADYVSPGYAGGDPSAMGTVPCLQSAFVQRYIKHIEVRTKSHWEVPLDAGADDFVQIRISVDHSGSLVTRKTLSSSDTALGRSAMRALASASPFPPLSDNNRCLTEKKFIMTFKP